MSTPDAAPVEVEGERPEVRWLPIAWHRDLPDETRWMPIDRNGGYLVKGSDWSGQSNDPVVVVAWPDGSTPTPPAAPTTPDIADERVRGLLREAQEFVDAHCADDLSRRIDVALAHCPAAPSGTTGATTGDES